MSAALAERVVAGLEWRCRALRQRVYRTTHERAAQRWVAARGDETYRLDYPLRAESIVFDLGGYRGDWTQRIVERFGCRVLVFEPVADFAAAIARRFARDPRVEVYDFGLGARDENVEIHLAGDASTLFARSVARLLGPRAPGVPARIRAFAPFLAERGIDRIDLLKVNIEGGEFDLLDAALEAGLVERIGDLQIQFHDFVPRARRRRAAIRRRLARTHRLTYDFPFVWENWRREIRLPSA